MKRVSPLILLIVLGCAKTPFDIAKKNVRQYINTMLNDPKQYESVSWGSLDSIFDRQMPIDFVIPPDKQAAFDRDYTDAKVYYGNNVDSLRAGVKRWLDINGIKYTEEYDKNKKVFDGYKIDHSFRIHGLKKQKILVKYRFYLDSALSVTKAVDQDVKAIDSYDKKIH